MTTRAVATLFVIVLAIGAVVSACWPKPAKAQDHHPAHRDFYRLWMQPGVYPPASCCNARVERDGIEVGLWIRPVPMAAVSRLPSASCTTA